MAQNRVRRNISIWKNRRAVQKSHIQRHRPRQLKWRVLLTFPEAQHRQAVTLSSEVPNICRINQHLGSLFLTPSALGTNPSVSNSMLISTQKKTLFITKLVTVTTHI